MKLLCAYNSNAAASLEVAQAYQAVHPEAELVPCPVNPNVDTDSIAYAYQQTYRFAQHIQAPIDAAVAGTKGAHVVLCYGIPWILHGTEGGNYTYYRCVDDALHLSASEGGGTYAYYTINPVRWSRYEIMRHETFRFVSRIDGPTKELAIGLITKAAAVAASGWETNEAVLDASDVNQYDEEAQILNAMKWQVRLDRGSGSWAPPPGSPSYYQKYSGDTTTMDFGSAAWPSRGWWGCCAQSQSAQTVRGSFRWVPYLITYGCFLTYGSTAEPTYARFPREPYVLSGLMRQGMTWGQAVAFGKVYTNYRILAIGDPMFRAPRLVSG